MSDTRYSQEELDRAFRQGRRGLILPAEAHLEWVGGNTADIIMYDDVGGNSFDNKKHILDIHYPHRCHRCKKIIYWEELYDANVKCVLISGDIDHFARVGWKWDFETYKKLKKLWKSKVVQFYCCDCYLKR